jgi:serine phosphatase RsbU (regulator of sigma subunit)
VSKHQFYRIVLVCAFLLANTCIKANKKDTLVHFSGKVYETIIDTDKKITYKNAIFKLVKTSVNIFSNKTAKNAVVSFILDDKVIGTQTVGSDGAFSFDFEYDKEYKIGIVKEGYYLSSILIDTRNVPDKNKKKGLKIATELDVIKKEEGVEKFTFFMVKIAFNAEEKVFKEDDKHNEYVHAELEKIRLNLIANKAVDKEMSKLSKQAKAKLYEDIALEREKAIKAVKEIIVIARHRADSTIDYIKKNTKPDPLPISNQTANENSSPVITDYKIPIEVNKADTIEEQMSVIDLPSEKEMNIILSDKTDIDDKKSQVENAKKLLEQAKLSATTKMDSLLIIEREAIILSAENKILMSEQKLQDAQKELELQSSQLKQEKTQRYALFLGIIMMMVLAFILYRSIKRKKEDNDTILLQKLAVEEQHQEITDSINYAKKIQSALLTNDSEWEKISADYFVYFKPRDVVSGDFFWSYHNEESDISVWATADCTGHGVPGAFMSMLGIGFLNEIVIENDVVKPDVILNHLREKIIKALDQNDASNQQKDGMDITLCVWDKANNEIEYAGANNSLWILRDIDKITEEQKSDRKTAINKEKSKGIIEFKADKQPVGAYTEVLQPFTTNKIPIYKGDTLITFTDGFPDQFGGVKGKKFMYKPFKQLFLDNHDISLADQKKNLEESFEVWRGDLEQIDDVCVVAIKV